MIRVGFASPVFCRGGVERWMMDLCDHLPEDIQVTGLGIPPAGVTDPAAVAEMRLRCPVVAGTAYRDVWDGADVLLAWGFSDLASVVGCFPGHVVCVSHGSDPWTAGYVQAAAAAGANVAAMSGAAVHPGVPADQLAVVAGGVGVDRLVPTRTIHAARRQLGVSDSAFTVGYVGRLSPEKRVDVLVRAVAGMDGCHALIVGDGTERRRLEALASSLGVEHRVHFTGHTYAVGDVLVAMDAFVGLSDHEGFWLAGIEAAAVGLPLVTTRVGVLRDIAARYGRQWLELSRGDDPHELAAAIADCRLYCECGALDFAERLQGIVLAEYTAERMGQRWGEYLRSLVRTPPRPLRPSLRPSHWETVYYGGIYGGRAS